jgi:hypothetical protein
MPEPDPESRVQIANFELAERTTKFRIILRDYLLPLISDAIDALEIENARPDVAARRLTRAAAIIREWLK